MRVNNSMQTMLTILKINPSTPQGDPDGGYVGSAFKNAIFSADTSRPVTANSEDTPGDTLTKVMDVNAFSYNYGEVCGGRDVRVGRCV